MDIAAQIDFTGLTNGLSARATGCGEQAAAPERVVLKLDPYRVASLQVHGPVAITCLSGQLWITLPGELDDIILKAGESRVLQARAGDIVISTAGARCPATFGIRTVAERANRRLAGGKQASPFQVAFS